MRNQRRLLAALGPVLFLVVLTAGMRLLTRATDGADAHAPALPPAVDRRTAPRRTTPPPTPPPPKPADPATQKRLVGVVSGQMACFARGDYPAAMAFAEAGFRSAWSADAFREMVTAGYYPLTRGLPATFGPGSTSGNRATLPVRLLSGDGEPILYDYLLEQSDGKWYVVGVAPAAPAAGGE